MDSLEDSVEFATNPDPRCACVLLLDTSGSMGGAPITALNEGLRAFQTDIQEDALARRRVEIAVVTFGGQVEIVQDFVTGGQFTAPQLRASGGTPMGAALSQAVDMIRDRKDSYRANGIAYYRPWILAITDGEPTDDWRAAAARIHDEETHNGLAFFAVGVDGANMATLEQIAVRKPVTLTGLRFTELFVWLSRSQRQVSASRPGEQVALPPAGWAAVYRQARRVAGGGRVRSRHIARSIGRRLPGRAWLARPGRWQRRAGGRGWRRLGIAGR